MNSKLIHKAIDYICKGIEKGAYKNTAGGNTYAYNLIRELESIAPEEKPPIVKYENTAELQERSK